MDPLWTPAIPAMHMQTAAATDQRHKGARAGGQQRRAKVLQNEGTVWGDPI